MRLVAGDLVSDIRNLGRVAMMVVVLATIGYLANHSGGRADGQFRRRPIQSGLAEGDSRLPPESRDTKGHAG
jgi:hypothetical protein